MLRLCIILLLCAAFLGMFGHLAVADRSLHPLQPPDRSSPSATLKTFLDDMNQAVQAYNEGHRDQVVAHVFRAVRCLDLSAEPPAIRQPLGVHAALYLKETLDRIEIPPYDQIPDAEEVQAKKISSWTLPYTEIKIAVKSKGSLEGEFVFTNNTVRNSETFYDKVENLPLKDGLERGTLYDQLSSSGGLIIPNLIFGHLPKWAFERLLGQAAWQWIGLVLYLVVGAGAVMLTCRISWYALEALDSKFESTFRHTLGGLILPITLIFFAKIGLWFVTYGLRFFTVDVYLPIAFAFLSILYIGILWLIGSILNRIAATVIAMGGFISGSIDTQLIRFSFQLLTFIIIGLTLLSLGASLGIPTYSMVTGLGIGGIAIALAGQQALSNLIGTVIILLDRPFKIGDYIVLGNGIQGSVSEIGLRSTRILTLNGLLVSVPNSKVSDMEITNESAPVSESRINIPVGVAYGSDAKVVEQTLLRAAKKSEFVAADPAPSVRFVEFGDSSLQFELLVWIVRPEMKGNAISQLNTAIYEECQKNGIELPFPQRDVHIRSTS
ncbi:MAG: mechanosensitive ion channel family protein [Desulfomonilaceae bacterium]